MKGVVAGGVNLALAVALGAAWPPIPVASRALVLGLLGYGVSLTLFVLALRHLGTARTGAYFSLAPFFGATASLLVLREPFTARLALAGALMAPGVWLHLTEAHGHMHQQERLLQYILNHYQYLFHNMQRLDNNHYCMYLLTHS